ncbi:MAG: DNA polymerase IV [Chitinophagaceae bacterium]
MCSPLPSTDRTIVHLDLDAFFVSVERLHRRELEGKPLIIGGSSDRGVVASCSYEARKFGVQSAMPMRLARTLCPQAILLRGDMELYSRHSALVTEIIADRAPIFEKASIDEHYLDISGMDRFIGSLKWTRELRQWIIRQTGLPISFGLSVNKTVSKMAAGESKPNGEMQVEKEQVKPFLFPLSIAKIPGVGTKTFQQLRTMGIDTIRTLSEMPADLLEKVLGEHGRSLWMKANGMDNHPVVPYTEQKSISTETTFEQDSTDILMMKRRLTKMVEELAFDLRSQQKLTSCITVKIRYANFDTHTLQKKIAYTSFEQTLIPLVHGLFDQLYNRRMLIRLIGVRLTQLVNGAQQIDLFQDTQEMMRLCMAIDQIKKRFGKDKLGTAAGIPTGR